MTRNVDTYHEAMRVLADGKLKQALYDESNVVMADTLLTLHGEAHRNRRLVELKVFRREHLHGYQSDVFPVHLAQVLREVDARGGMDLVDFGYRVTINMTADFAGVDRPQKTVEETDALQALVKRFSAAATLIHSRLDKELIRQNAEDALGTLGERFVEPSIARRRRLLEQFAAGTIAEADLPHDVLTLLLRNDDLASLPKEVMLREIAFYLLAGFHSTAHSVTHAMHELFHYCDANPEYIEKIRHDPVFLQQCVHESMRLHPISPVACRRADPLAGSTEAPELIVVHLGVANREKAIFGDDADSFNPNRQLSPEVSPWGLTFGYGRHVCLGRELDGGSAAAAAANPCAHQLGSVTQIIRALLARNVRRDPSKAPSLDAGSDRPNWGSYPVLIDLEEQPA